MSELNLFLAVERTREAIRYGASPREAAMLSAEKYRVPFERVALLAHRAETECRAARERLVIAARLGAGSDPLGDAFLEPDVGNRRGRPTKSASAAAELAELFTQRNTNPGVSMGEFARIIGRSPSFVTGLKQAGRLVMVGERRVDVEGSMALIEATANSSAAAS